MPAPPAVEHVVRLCGSDMIGAKLMHELVEVFLVSTLQCTSVSRTPRTAEQLSRGEELSVGCHPPSWPWVRVAITPLGAEDGIHKLARGSQPPVRHRHHDARRSRTPRSRVARHRGQARPAGKHVLVLGFTDDQDDPQANQRLAESRAAEVAAKLPGVPEVKTIRAIGFGVAMPIGSNRDERGQRRNRRVEVWVK